jgi:hypothetical protein
MLYIRLWNRYLVLKKIYQIDGQFIMTLCRVFTLYNADGLNNNCLFLITSSRCKILFYFILFYSILFYSILFYSILFYSILFYSILFYSILFYSILFYSILFYSILFYSILFYSCTWSCRLHLSPGTGV